MSAVEVPGQVVVPAAVVAFAFLAVGFFVLLVLIAAAIACWWRDRRASQHDVGPDALRLLEDLDEDLDAYVADYPDIAEGFARLTAALNEQQGGESA
jgi:hypothetical protein